MQHDWLGYLPRFDLNAPIVLAVAASAIGSFVSLACVSAGNARQRAGQRRLTALELALSLESYARSCRTMMHKASWAAAESGHLSNNERILTVALPTFVFPELTNWNVFGHKTVSLLREFPATVHAACEYVEALRAFSDARDFCSHVELECAKTATVALELALITRRRHGASVRRRTAMQSDTERELREFIETAEKKRRDALRQKSDDVGKVPVSCLPVD